jgi:hypothetical protein
MLYPTAYLTFSGRPPCARKVKQQAIEKEEKLQVKATSGLNHEIKKSKPHPEQLP